jgi:hypothetical protein
MIRMSLRQMTSSYVSHSRCNVASVRVPDSVISSVASTTSARLVVQACRRTLRRHRVDLFLRAAGVLRHHDVGLPLIGTIEEVCGAQDDEFAHFGIDVLRLKEGVTRRRVPPSARVRRDKRTCGLLGVALRQAALICRAAASAVSSGRVLKAIVAFGAALWMMFTTVSNSTRPLGGSRMPPPITTQS